MNIRGRNKVNPNFNMSSMTDIVFLLLIFFMITSTLMSPHAVKLNLPYSDSNSYESEKIIVTIDSTRNYFIGDNQVEVKESSDMMIVLEEQLKIEFEEKRSNGFKIEDLGISLRADETLDIKYIVEILDIARGNNWKVALSTK
ncbi:MAG: ExbD/TolR family protein [Flavobacteriales bacterium]